MIDYYNVLGILPDANEKEIKAAYRQLSKKYHPDTVPDSPLMAEKFHGIQCAYEILGDSDKRRKYDEERKGTEGTKKTGRTSDSEPKPVNPDMSQFERFFGFQPGKGMETYQDRNVNVKKAEGPIKPDDLFAAFFGTKKR